MKFSNCAKCGNTNASNTHKSKVPFKALGKFWCGHCGGKLEKECK